MIPSINITVNVIDVVIARPIIKPVLELPLVDVVDAKKIKNKICWQEGLTWCLKYNWCTHRSFNYNISTRTLIRR